MPQIRPVSDLRNNFAEISRIVHEVGEPVFLTNEYCSMTNEYLETEAMIKANGLAVKDAYRKALGLFS